MKRVRRGPIWAAAGEDGRAAVAVEAVTMALAVAVADAVATGNQDPIPAQL
jgi:hypothetical protein